MISFNIRRAVNHVECVIIIMHNSQACQRRISSAAARRSVVFRLDYHHQWL